MGRQEQARIGQNHKKHTHTPVGIVGLGFPGGASGKESACQGRRHKRHG